jgi:hypothetical protein
MKTTQREAIAILLRLTIRFTKYSHDSEDSSIDSCLFSGDLSMIHHISIDAQDPLKVASVLAEILNGKVYDFFIPGSALVIPFDKYGTHIVVFKLGDVWAPGADAEAAKVLSADSAHLVSSHAAMSVTTDHSHIEKIGKREGWRVLTRHKGATVAFSAVELWVENRVLFEFFTPEFLPQYLQVMRPDAIAQMMGEPIQPIAV